MSWNAPVDLYCERLGPGLLAEPVNALTNLGFLLAAWLLWRRLKGREQATDLRALTLLVALVGLGSLVFHTVATAATSRLDTGFITLFLLLYVHRWLVRVAGLGTWPALLGVAAFVLLDAGLRRLLAELPLNGSQFYAAAFLALLCMGLYGTLRAVPGSRLLLAAFALFLGSVTLRSVDLALCPQWPLGTHFLWHLANAGVLYLAVVALAGRGRTPWRCAPPPEGDARLGAARRRA
jgi:hypothetical protein